METKKILEIVKNGGATLDKNYNNFSSNNGFMVSLQGQEIKVNKDNIEEIKREIEKKREFIKDKRGLYIGLWLDDEIMYIDVSIHIINYLKALEIGRHNKQLAIFDLKNKDSIYLNYMTYYNLYRVIKDNNDKIIDYKLIRQYDNIKEITKDLKENTKAIYNCTFKSLKDVKRLLNNKYCFIKDTITLEELTA